jgi:hypothetical protein
MPIDPGVALGATIPPFSGRPVLSNAAIRVR